MCICKLFYKIATKKLKNANHFAKKYGKMLAD